MTLSIWLLLAAVFTTIISRSSRLQFYFIVKNFKVVLVNTPNTVTKQRGRGKVMSHTHVVPQDTFYLM